MRLSEGTYTQENLYKSLSVLLKQERSLHITSLLFFKKNKNELIEIFERKGFKVNKEESFGELTELKFDYNFYDQKKEAYFYIFQHPTKKEIFFIFSFCNLTALYRAIPYIITSNPETHCLWLSPNNFDKLREFILSEKENYMVFFHGKKIRNIKKAKNEIKIEYERDVKYKGIDAQNVEEKLKIEYGISASSIEFVVPKIARFRITKEGIYTIKKGDVQWFFNEILKRIVNITEEDHLKIEESKIDLIREDNLDKIELNTAEFKSQSSIDFDRFPEFIELMKENDFVMASSILKKGSVIFSGEVVDNQKGNIFSLSSNGRSFIVAPLFSSSNSSILRFYRFLTEKIDPNIILTNGT